MIFFDVRDGFYIGFERWITIMLIVFRAMVVIALLLVSGGVVLSLCNSDGESGGVFS